MIDPDLFPQDLPAGWVPGEGRHGGAMIVGQAPGWQEWEADPRRPFLATAPCGELLRSILEAEGVDPEEVYITNLVKILPTDDGVTVRKDGPNDSEIDAALPYFKEEIQFVVPRFILALGNTVYQTLTGSILGISLYRGLWQRLDEQFDWDEAVVMPTFHPSHVLRKKSADTDAIFHRDVKEFIDAWKDSYVHEYP